MEYVFDFHPSVVTMFVETVEKQKEEFFKFEHENQVYRNKIRELNDDNAKLTSSVRELQVLTAHSEELRQDNHDMTEELENMKEKVTP